MKKIIAYLPTHALYCIGHVASKIMNWGDGWFSFLYPVYNRCMMWSLTINDWGGLTVWTEPSMNNRSE